MKQNELATNFNEVKGLKNLNVEYHTNEAEL